MTKLKKKILHYESDSKINRETITDGNPNQSWDHDQDVNKNEATDVGEEATDIGDHSTEVKNLMYIVIGWGKL